MCVSTFRAEKHVAGGNQAAAIKSQATSKIAVAGTTKDIHCRRTVKGDTRLRQCASTATTGAGNGGTKGNVGACKVIARDHIGRAKCYRTAGIPKQSVVSTAVRAQVDKFDFGIFTRR